MYIINYEYQQHLPMQTKSFSFGYNATLTLFAFK